MSIDQVVCRECGGRGAYSKGPYPATKCNYCGGKGYVVTTAPQTDLEARIAELEAALSLASVRADAAGAEVTRLRNALTMTTDAETAAEARCAVLARELAEAREALTPFAGEAATYDRHRHWPDGLPDKHWAVVHIQVGDLRRARSSLKETSDG